jgi:hypothetical protein
MRVTNLRDIGTRVPTTGSVPPIGQDEQRSALLQVALPECDKGDDENTCGRAAVDRQAGARRKGRMLSEE